MSDFRDQLTALGLDSPYVEAAEALGVSWQQVYKLVAGKQRPSKGTRRLMEMFRRYGVPDDFRSPD